MVMDTWMVPSPLCLQRRTKVDYDQVMSLSSACLYTGQRVVLVIHFLHLWKLQLDNDIVPSAHISPVGCRSASGLPCKIVVLHEAYHLVHL
jgi:hypothetical protein